MEANSTECKSKPLAQRPFTENPSLGRLFEGLAAQYYERQGFRIGARNVRVGKLEADILIEEARGILLVEVRGRSTDAFRPSRCLSARKVSALHRLAQALRKRYRCAVRVELVEVLVLGADPPQFHCFKLDL